MRLLVLMLFTLAAFGQATDAGEIAALEKQAAAQPQDRLTRIRLLYYYQRAIMGRPDDPWLAQMARLKHISWFIEHETASVPAAASVFYIAGSGAFGSASEHKQLLETWQRIAAAHPTDWPILRNAALFLAVEHRQLARELLEAAQARLPGNPAIPVTLGFLYAMDLLGLDNLGGDVAMIVPEADQLQARNNVRRMLDEATNPAVLAGAGYALLALPVVISHTPLPASDLKDLGSQLQQRANEASMKAAEEEFDNALRQSSLGRNPAQSPGQLRRVSPRKQN